MGVGLGGRTSPAETRRRRRIVPVAEPARLVGNAVYGWLLLLPAAVLLAAFTHYPAVATLAQSLFTSGTALRPAEFAGLDNYRYMLEDEVFWRVLENNAWYAIGTIPVSIALAMLMAVWVNRRMPARAFVRMSYFTPTVLPMIAVANIWLFFYTPEIGLIDQIAAGFGIGSHNWLGNPDTVLGCIIVLTIWKEAGFFMIFYLAALQSLPPELEEAARLEGASRWHFFRRVTFPLLMPTTLFVLINAVINSFKLVDQLFILTKGGPDNASALLLYYIYEVAFSFFDQAYASTLTVVLLAALAINRHRPVRHPRQADSLPMRRGGPQALVQGIENAAALLLAVLWLAPLLYAFWAAFHPPEYSIRFDLLAPLTLENFREAWEQAPFARYFLNTFMLVTSILAAQFVLCTLAAYAFAPVRVSGPGGRLRARPDATHDHAGGADRRELPHHEPPRPGGHDPRHRPAVHGQARFGIFLLRQTFKTVAQGARRRGPGRRLLGPCRCCGRSTCRWRVRRTSPTAWCRSATTGTTFSGRW